MSRMENLLERMLRTMEEGFSSMEKGFSSLNETMERGFSRVERRLAKIDHRLAGIENALGIPAEGRGREVLLEWLQKKGEMVEKVQVSVQRKPEDVVVYTDRAVYVMEAKNQITGERVGGVLRQIQRHVERMKEKLAKQGAEKDVVPVVYAWKMSKKAIRELEKHGVVVLREGKDTLAAPS